MYNPCENCKRNCCGNKFKGLAKNFKNYDKNLFNQILLSNEEVERIKNNGGEKFIECFNGNYFIKLNKNRSCTAFINGKCAIYDVRPDVCKMYPYYFDPFAGICVDNKCYAKNYFINKEIFDSSSYLELLEKRINFFKEIQSKKK